MCRLSGRRTLAVSASSLATTFFCSAFALAMVGCGEKSEQPAAAKAPAQKAGAQESSETTAASKPADSRTTASDPKPQTPLVAERDDTPRKPATAEEAQRILDLSTFPLPKDAKSEGQSTIALVRYKVPGDDVKSAYDFVQQQFAKRGWKEVDKPNITAQYASGTFGGQGFYAAVSAYQDSSQPDAKLVGVSINNQGNLNLAKLPVPPESKLQYSQPTNIGYLTELPIDAATEAVGKLLAEQGWTPYGDNVGMRIYKQNAIELKVHVSEMPTMKGKNMISFFPTLLSADLPAPPQPLSIAYTDYLTPPKQLIFESSAPHEELYTYYRETLGKTGWQPTTDNPIKDDRKWFMIFRNGAKDLIELETSAEPDENKISGTLKHQSAAELAEIERQIKLDRPRREAEAKKRLEEEQAQQAKAEQDRKDKEAAEKARRRVAVSAPADAKDLKFEADGITFNVPSGKARTAAESIAKQLRDAGWKEDKPPTDATAGSYNFKKEDQSIHIIYLDPRVIPAEVRVTGFRVDFEQVDKAAKK